MFNYRVNISPKASPCGCRTRKTWILRLNDRNFKEPYCTGEYDQYDYIQSFAQECDMRVLITRYLNGDPALLPESWIAGNMQPTDLRSILDAHNRLENAYNTLSDADKANISLNDIISQLGNPDGLKQFINARVDAAKAESTDPEVTT